MLQSLSFWCRCLGAGTRGSIPFANDWQWTVGNPTVAALAPTAIAYFAAWFGPEYVSAEHPVLGPLVVALVAFMVTWFVAAIAGALKSAPALYYQQKRRADGLEERLRPKMKVVFDPDNPNCDSEITFTDQSKSRCVRLQVENTGTAPIFDCEGWLSVKEMPATSGFRMFWAGSGGRGKSASEIPDTVDLVERVPRYVQVFRIHQTNAIIPGTAGEVWPLGGNHSFEVGKTYHFDIALKARDDAETVVRTIRLNWTGDWQIAEVSDVTAQNQAKI